MDVELVRWVLINGEKILQTRSISFKSDASGNLCGYELSNWYEADEVRYKSYD